MKFKVPCAPFLRLFRKLTALPDSVDLLAMSGDLEAGRFRDCSLSEAIRV